VPPTETPLELDPAVCWLLPELPLERLPPELLLGLLLLPDPVPVALGAGPVPPPLGVPPPPKSPPVFAGELQLLKPSASGSARSDANVLALRIMSLPPTPFETVLAGCCGRFREVLAINFPSAHFTRRKLARIVVCFVRLCN
jgi:hypothetical protein